MTSASVTFLKSLYLHADLKKREEKAVEAVRVHAIFKLAFCSDVMFVSLWTGSVDVVLGWILCTHKWWFSQIFPSDLQVGHAYLGSNTTYTFNGVVPTLLHGQANSCALSVVHYGI